MEQFFSQHILSLIENYGAFGMFLGGFIEEIISIIPSSLIQLTGGLLIMKHDPISFISISKLIFIVAIPSAFGYTLGSLPYFLLVKKGGIVFIEKYGKYLGFSKESYDKLVNSLNKDSDDEVLFFITRLTPMIPGIVCNVYAGLTQMKMRTFLLCTFFGVAIRAIFVAFIGWQLYNYIPVILEYKFVAIMLLVFIITTWILLKRKFHVIK